jgi:hypothetical protein
MKWSRDTGGVSSGQTRVPLYRPLTLDPTVGLCSNFYRSFKRLVSLASLRNRQDTLVVSPRTRL